jgi:sugar O-acyltransferase (sialic acid O-acetyltransferase NeuD family)
LNLIIIGAGGHGSEVYSYTQDLVRETPGLRVTGFVDEHKARGDWGETEVLGNFEDLRDLVGKNGDVTYVYITAVGNNRVRRELVEKLTRMGAPNLSAWSLIHPRACVGRGVNIGIGTCLAPGSIVTTRVRIGEHCIVNVNASVSHDSVVGDFVNINPGAVVAGNARIGDGCFIGAGATVIDKVSVGAWSIIGAGAVVVDDIPPHVTAVGVPARVIKRHQI